MPERNLPLIEKLKKTSDDLKSHGSEMIFDSGKKPIITERRQFILDGILTHLQNPDKIRSSIMIDAETGYGKTYDIGLLSHTSALAGYSHLIAVPSNELVGQAKSIINEAFDLKIKTPDSIDELIKSLQQQDKEPITIIISHDLLLANENFQQLKGTLFSKEEQGLLISIDEADSINDTIPSQNFENLRQINTQAKNKPLYYWTATPDPRFTHDMCGTVITPARSKRRAITTVIRARNFITKTNNIERFTLVAIISLFTYVIPYLLIRYKYVPPIIAKLGFTSSGLISDIIIRQVCDGITLSIVCLLMCIVIYVCEKVFGLNLGIPYFKRIVANLINLFESVEDPNPIYEYVEQCEETFEYREIKDSKNMDDILRWNIHSPIGESALILANDIDDIMNLNFVLQGEKGENKIYQNDKTLSMNRYKLYDRIAPEGMDSKTYRKRLRESNFVNCIKQHYPNIQEGCILELKNKVDFESNTPLYLKYRVMYGLIDLTLQYIMKCDNTELDEKRKNNLSKLVNNIKSSDKCSSDKCLSDKDLSYIVDFLKKKGFSKEFAQDQLGKQVQSIIHILSKPQHDNERIKLIVDNWRLSKDLHQLMNELMQENSNLDLFCKNNRRIFAKLGKNDLGIKEDKPFFAISYEDNKYTPEYCCYKECDIEALAKCSLISLIDGSRGRGFDSEYNHVASIFTRSYSEYNNPENVIQNLGRNRERNPNRQSWFFVATGCKTQLFIENVLNKIHSKPKAFYSNVLLPAQKQFNKLKKSRMGIELGEKIEEHVANVVNKKIKHEDSCNSIDSIEELVRNTCTELLQINSKMNFDKKQTCKEMRKICKDTEKYLITYSSRIRDKDRLPILYKVPCYVISVMMKSVYYMFITFDRIIFKIKALNIDKEIDDFDKATTYVYIINNYNAEKVLKCQKIMNKAYSLAHNRKDQDVKKILNLFHNKMYINALNQSISFLLNGNSEHLLTMLDVLYENGKNREKLNKIVKFKKDLTRLSPEEMVDQYHDQSSELLQIVAWINSVNDEVVKYHKYYYNIDIGNSIDKKKVNPNFKGHKIYNIRSSINFCETGQKHDKNLWAYSVVVYFIVCSFWVVCKYAFMKVGKGIPINYMDCLFNTITVFTKTQAISVILMSPFMSVCAMGFDITWSTLCSFMFFSISSPMFMWFLFDFNLNLDVLFDMNELELIDKQEEAKNIEINSVINVQSIFNFIDQQNDKSILGMQ